MNKSPSVKYFSLEKCPYCAKEKVAGTVKCVDVHFIQKFVNIYGHCNSCLHGVIGSFKFNKNTSLEALCNMLDKIHDYSDWGGTYFRKMAESIVYTGSAENIETIVWLPEPKLPNAPAHLPSDVEKTFLQAEKLMSIEDMYNQAGFSYRRTLELAIKHIDASISGNLNTKIKELGNRNLLTPSMVEFAHTIRILGNEAVHDDVDLPQEEAEDLQAFTNLFLQYVFTLPAMIPQRVKDKIS